MNRNRMKEASALTSSPTLLPHAVINQKIRYKQDILKQDETESNRREVYE